MRNLKKGLIIFGFLLVILVFLLNFGFNSTGNVVWEPNTVLKYYDNAEITSLWDEIFIENSQGINILDIIGDDNCNKLVFKIKNSELWYFMLCDDTDNRYIDDVLCESVNGSYIVTSYINASFNILGKYSTPLSLQEFDNMLLDIIFNNDVENWTVSTINDANSKFSSVYKVSDVDFEYNSSAYSYNYENTSGLLVFDSDAIIMFNKSIIIFDWSKFSYKELEEFTFTQDIPDFVFELNDSWNNAFNISDYIDINNNGSYLSLNNKKVNMSYNIENNVVMFRSVENETGSNLFVLNVYNSVNDSYIESNVFNVTFVEDINYPPILVRDFEPFEIPKNGGIRVYLNSYFNDPDGDNMTYSIDNSDNLIINITDNVMIIKLKDGFNDSVLIRIYADDGEFMTKSNEIWVFSDYSTLNVSLTQGDLENLSGSIVNNSNNKENNSNSFNSNWFIFIGILIIISGLILFIIWFFILRKKDDFGGGENIITNNINNQNSQNVPVNKPVSEDPVNDYLKKLDLNK